MKIKSNQLLLFNMMIVCIGLLIFIKKNNDIKHELTKNQNKKAKLESYLRSEEYTNRFFGKKFPEYNLIDIFGKCVTSDFSSYNYSIILLFKPQSCQPCLLFQLNLLNKLNKYKLNDQVHILAISNEDISALKRFALVTNTSFPVLYDVDGKIFQNDFVKKTPAIFMVNSDSKIIRSHVSTLGENNYTALFFSQLQKIIKTSEPIIVNNEYDLLAIIKGEKDLY